MINRLRTVARLYDERPIRERLLLAAAAVAVVLGLADALLLEPALAQWHAADKHRQQAQQLHTSLLGNVRLLADKNRQQDLALRNEVDSWRQRVVAGEASLRNYERSLVGPDQMSQLLEAMLTHHGQLTVRALRTLPRVDLLAAPGADAAAAAPAGNANTATTAAANAPAGKASAPGEAAGEPGALPSLYRHGVELVVEGPYGDLMAYLAALEDMPQHVLWGSMQLSVEQYPTNVLTLRLYTISRDRHWLEI